MTQAGPKRIVTLTDDHELNRFLHGQLGKPQERVTRKGAPEHRPELREPRSVADIMAATRGKILRQARIHLMESKFYYGRISTDQIRLLRIRPGKPDDPIQCELSVTRLSEAKGKYEALSYCWGNELATEIIEIQTWDSRTPAPCSQNGHELYRLPQRFPVRPNLYKALRHLRNQKDPVVIWVDAICINQKEEPEAKLEKNQQLSMMSEIYNSAYNVCIWLGTADPKSEVALEFVGDIMDFSNLTTLLDQMNPLTEERWCDLIHILNAPWFSRRWIIQEIASAPKASVHFGDDSVHWDDLADAVSLLNKHHETLRRKTKKEIFARVPMLSAVHLVEAIHNVCRKSDDGKIVEKLLDFETLVCTFQQFHATFSEDIIHSVRALAKDAPDQQEEDDLRTSVEHEKSTRDLFIAFVNRCILNSRSLDIICRHWAPPATDSVNAQVKLPTWISELTKGPFGLSREFHERQNGENFVAITAQDKVKRYNASSGYHHFDDQANLDHRPRKSSIVPTISVSAPNSTSDLETNQIFFGGEVLLSPLASPALEEEEISTMRSFDSLDADTQGGGSPSNSSPNLHTRVGTISQLQTAKEASTRLEIITNHSYAEDRSPLSPLSTMGPPSRISIANSGQPESAIPKPVPKKRAFPAFADIVEQTTQRHQPRRRRVYSPRSEAKQKQNSWTQEDKEHNEKLGGTLLVHGLVFGTIKRRSDVMRGGIVPGQWLQKLGWDRKSRENHVPDSVWRTLVADRQSSGRNPPPWYQRACLHCLKDTRITNSKGDLDSYKVHRVSETQTFEYLTRVGSVVWRRRIVEVDSRGHVDQPCFGLAPEETEDGDLVCILFGCSVPVILRKSERVIYNNDLEDAYEVVGESYIHGKMDGEAVQDARWVSQQKQRFFLK